MGFLDWVGILCAVALLANFVSLVIAMVRCRPRMAFLPAPADAPAVSVVRPLCGLDNFCEETLRSTYELDYPVYEVIFCVASGSDPVVPLARRLMDAHPQIPSRLIIGDEPVSANPKLNNCVRGWDAARHDWIVLADANVLMPRDYLQRLLASWRPDTGLVCSTPIGARPAGFWAEVECAFLNTLQARWQYVGEAVGLGFAQGKTMLWHRDLLERHGGIRALAAELAEDAAATKLVRQAGRHVHLVDMPFEQPLGYRPVQEVWARQLRWARLRRATFPLFFFPEIFSGPLVIALAASLAATSWGWSPLTTAAAVFMAWYVPEAVLARTTGWHFSWRMPLAFLARDLALPVLWTAAWLGHDFVWRGSAMTVREARS